MNFSSIVAMLGNYDDRKVGRYEADGLRVSTALVYDAAHPYETAVAHPEYNDDKWVIVEAYNSLEEAARGHERWVKTMTSESLPSQLVDCANSEISQIIAEIGGKMVFPRTPRQ